MRVQVSINVFRYPYREPHHDTDVVAMREDGYWYGGSVQNEDGYPPYIDNGIEGMSMKDGTLWFYLDDVRNAAQNQMALADCAAPLCIAEKLHKNDKTEKSDEVSKQLVDSKLKQLEALAKKQKKLRILW